MPRSSPCFLITVNHALVSTSRRPKTTRGAFTSLSVRSPVARAKDGAQVGDFQHPFTVLLPNTVFLSGETWATLWEVVFLASIRGQLQC